MENRNYRDLEKLWKMKQDAKLLSFRVSETPNSKMVVETQNLGLGLQLETLGN